MEPIGVIPVADAKNGGMSASSNPTISPWWLAGLFLTPLRWVMGWLFFSAFWRRVVLKNALNPGGANYVGQKINHFLPHALLIKPLIAMSLSSPHALHLGLWAFTIGEGLVGIALLIGLATRLAGLALAGLSFGILLGAGWLGTTCLDEWQIGCLGVVSGLLIVFGGAGPLSADAWLAEHFPHLASKRIFPVVTSGNLGIDSRRMQRLVLGTSVVVLVLTLWTNQVFHGGVWGKLHNKSVHPHLVVSEAALGPDNGLTFTVFRDEGSDTYGAFLVAVELFDGSGTLVQRWDAAALSALGPADIRNRWLVKVKPVKYSLEVPLGAQAEVRLPSSPNQSAGTPATVVLYDVSGATWSAPLGAHNRL